MISSVEKLYENLGKLFYAIAAVDDIIHKEEIDTLKKIVERDWVRVDDHHDEFGTDAAYFIEIIFDWLEENQPPAYQAFYEFKEFKEENEKLFTLRIKKLIWKTALSIAESFGERNTDEQTMLSKLRELLE